MAVHPIESFAASQLPLRPAPPTHEFASAAHRHKKPSVRLFKVMDVGVIATGLRGSLSRLGDHPDAVVRSKLMKNTNQCDVTKLLVPWRGNTVAEVIEVLARWQERDKTNKRKPPVGSSPPPRKKGGGPCKKAATQRSHSSLQDIVSLSKKLKDFYWAAVALDREELQEFVRRELGSNIKDVEQRIAVALAAAGAPGKER